MLLQIISVLSAPYVKLDMNPFLPGVDERAVYKDAMFFSVHKFIGGVQTPGWCHADYLHFSVYCTSSFDLPRGPEIFCSPLHLD